MQMSRGFRARQRLVILLKAFMIFQRVRAVRANARTLPNLRQVKPRPDSRVHRCFGIDLPDFKVPVLGADESLQPRPFWQAGSVTIQGVAHAGNLAMLHTVGPRKQV